MWLLAIEDGPRQRKSLTTPLEHAGLVGTSLVFEGPNARIDHQRCERL